MRLIDFSKIGGYRLKQKTFRYMQEAYYWILKSFIGFLGLPDTGNYIIYGCKVVGPNITSGMMYIDGELCPFTSIAGNDATKIKKLVTIEPLAFKNGNNENVFRQTTAIEDASGTALSAFNQLAFVQDSNYVHTDNNFTASLLAKLNAIEDGAEVNVQADFNVTNPLSDAYIKNMPIIPNILRSATVSLGAFVSNTTTVVNFPDVGTSNYKVIISIESLNPFGYRGHDIMAYATAAHTPTSFDFQALAFLSGARNIKLHYILIKN